MEISQEARESIAHAARKLIEAFSGAVREVFKKIWDFFKSNLPAIERILCECKESEVRRKNNKRTRSSWVVKFDTRKPSQVFDRRPVHTVRKIIY